MVADEITSISISFFDSVAETRCKKVEEELQKLKEGHAALQEQLASTQVLYLSRLVNILCSLKGKRFHVNGLLSELPQTAHHLHPEALVLMKIIRSRLSVLRSLVSWKQLYESTFK